MDQEIIEYEKYLLSFGVVNRPKMPKFDVLAYTDNEYKSIIFDIQKDFDLIDDEYLTIEHIRGD